MENAYQQKLVLKAWADADKPREKLLATGRRSLSDAELIAILIGSGNTQETAVDLSKRILHKFSNDLNTLGKQSVQDLLQFKGIGEAKAISIIAALELGRRRKEDDSQTPVFVKNSKDAYLALNHQFKDINHEEFWVILLNRANKILQTQLISKGGVTGTVVDAKIVFKYALEQNAVGIVLAHNHPSGNLNPSAEDLNITKKLKEGGKLLDINVVDHLIFTDEYYTSFADQGLM